MGGAPDVPPPPTDKVSFTPATGTNTPNQVRPPLQQGSSNQFFGTLGGAGAGVKGAPGDGGTISGAYASPKAWYSDVLGGQ